MAKSAAQSTTPKADKMGPRKKLAISALRWRLHSPYAGIHVQANWDKLKADGRPTLLLANHSSAWDGFLAAVATVDYLKLDPYILGDAATTPFWFNWAGQFGVDRKNPLRAVLGIRYATELLRTVPDCALWIFPEGSIRPFARRPLTLQHGAATVLQQAKVEVRIVPTVLYYAFIEFPKPEVFLTFGDPVTVDPNLRREDLTAKLSEIMTAEMDRVLAQINCQDTRAFQTLMHAEHDLRYRFYQLFGRANSKQALNAWGTREYHERYMTPAVRTVSVNSPQEVPRTV